MMRLILLTFWSFVQIFVFCDMSEYVTSHFNEIDFYNKCDWYSFPTVIRHLMPTLIVNTQQPVVVKGFGNISCTRETFKRVTFESQFHASSINLNTFKFFLRWNR